MFLVDRLPKEHSSSADQSLGNSARFRFFCCVLFLIDVAVVQMFFYTILPKLY